MDETEFDVASWKKTNLNNPLLRQVAGLQVWEQKGVTFTILNRETVDQDGNIVTLADKHIRLDGGFDPAAGVWTDRPDLSTAPVWAFDSGVTRREKLTALRQDMAAQKAEWLLLTDLTDVAWALELRGGDVACTPVFLGFLLVGTDSAALYAQAESFAPEIRAALAADGAALRPYGDIYDALRALPEGARVLADSATANSRIAECLADRKSVV